MRNMRYDRNRLADRILGLVNECGMSQGELAMKLKVDSSYVSYVLNGKRGLTIERLHEVCDLFQTTPNYLVYGSLPKHLREPRMRKS